VLAQDVWTDPAPGVRHLVRTAPGPIRFHAAVIDLNRSDLYVRATRPDERGRTPSNFANHVGAVVAVNGDWFGSGFHPTGLAVGQGRHWEGTADNGWAFIACTVERNCHYGNHPVNEALNPRWYDVVGGNGWRLVVDGQVPTYPGDAFYTAREPRTAVGSSADGNTMYFVVVEGRRADSIGIGFRDLGIFMRDLGAHQALMLDGGGSSAMIINGTRITRRPSNEPSERTVANHLAIMRGQADGRCANTPNGRYCDGAVIHTCQGGQHMGQGDCAFFGASCEITSDGIGVCVHPFCTNGAEGKYCESATHINTCAYGQPQGAGDCSAYGATCEDNGEKAYCVHFACTEGGNATWCKDDATVGRCVDGQPQDDVACGAQVCSQGACVDPDEPGPGTPDVGRADVGTPDPGVPDAGHVDSPDADLPGLGDAAYTDTDEPSAADGTASSSSCDCSMVPGGPSPLVPLGVLVLFGAARHPGRRLLAVDGA
ncbi:MAG: phosphodiester glycosidase family protein, partial [Bradymonadaceae bacterium]